MLEDSNWLLRLYLPHVTEKIAADFYLFDFVNSVEEAIKSFRNCALQEVLSDAATEGAHHAMGRRSVNQGLSSYPV